MNGLKKAETIKFQKDPVPIELLRNISFYKLEGKNCWRATLAVFPARIRKLKVSVYMLAELHMQLESHTLCALSTACQYSDIVTYACVIVESHCQYMYTL